jgi:hypothetical protein
LKKLVFFIPLVLFFILAFSWNADKIIYSRFAYSHADTAFIDSITNDITEKLSSQKYDRVIAKAFAEGSDSGTIYVYYEGSEVISCKMIELRPDSFEYSASYINGKLVYLRNHTHYREDTASEWLVDRSETTATFYYKNKQVKTIISRKAVFEKQNDETLFLNTFYYFNNSGDPVADFELGFNQLIKFAHSKKSYAEFFPAKRKVK